MALFLFYKKYIHFSLNFWSLFLLVTFIPDFIGISGALVTNGLWAIKASTAIWVIVLYPKKIYHLSWEEKLFFMIALIYFFNMTIDIFLQKTPIGIGDPQHLMIFILSILIAMAFRYDPLFDKNKSFYFFLGSLALGLLVAFFVARPSPPPMIGRYDANSIVNTINYGQTGCALALVSIYGFLNRKFKFSQLVYALLFILGILSIMKAGSRAPVVVLFGVLVFYYFSKAGFLKALIGVGIATIFLYFSISFLMEISQAVDSGIVERLVSSIENGETSGRDKIYANVFGIIAKSSFFGSYYIIPSGLGVGGYPHNFFLEAFLTMGIFGGVPFVFMVLLSLKRSYTILKYRDTSGWIVLLYLQLLIFGMFSSALFSSQDFWGLCFFILSMKPLSYRNSKKPKIEMTFKTNLIFNTPKNEY